MALPATGSLVILHNQAVALLPQFYVGNSLIVGGRKLEQQLWRTTSLQAQLAGVVAEVVWTGLHPAALSQSTCAAALLAAAALNAVHLCTIYGLTGLEYTAELGFWLSFARALLLVPANQVPPCTAACGADARPAGAALLLPLLLPVLLPLLLVLPVLLPCWHAADRAADAHRTRAAARCGLDPAGRHRPGQPTPAQSFCCTPPLTAAGVSTGLQRGCRHLKQCRHVAICSALFSSALLCSLLLVLCSSLLSSALIYSLFLCSHLFSSAPLRSLHLPPPTTSSET